MRKKETSSHRQVLGKNDMKSETCVLTTWADFGVGGIAPVRVTQIQFAVKEIIHLQSLGDVCRSVTQLWGCTFCLVSHQGHSERTLIFVCMQKNTNLRMRRAASYQLCDLGQIPFLSLNFPFWKMGIMVLAWPASQRCAVVKVLYRLQSPG